jgi:hypothetical protein
VKLQILQPSTSGKSSKSWDQQTGNFVKQVAFIWLSPGPAQKKLEATYPPDHYMKHELRMKANDKFKIKCKAHIGDKLKGHLNTS